MGSVAAASQISEEVISRLLEIKLSANVVFAKTVDQKGQVPFGLCARPYCCYVIRTCSTETNIYGW